MKRHWLMDEVLACLRNAECHLLDRDDWQSEDVADARTKLRGARTRICDMTEWDFVQSIRGTG
jgi:hypothetical protein